MDKDVTIIIGAGGMGQAIARRCGGGTRLLLADFSQAVLDAGAQNLRGEGYQVDLQPVDVGDPASVRDLAQTASGLGKVVRIAHTAGLSAVQAGPAAILRVDLLGVALILDEFARVIAPGGAAVVISSMAGHMSGPLPTQTERALATTPTGQLLDLPFLAPERVGDSGAAYVIAKRGAVLRVQAAAGAWGAQGARVNCISPGVIATPMGRQELDGESGDRMRAMIQGSAAGRIGTPDDIAAAAAFLLGPDADFVTGTDLLVDGGVIAAVRSAA